MRKRFQQFVTNHKQRALSSVPIGTSLNRRNAKYCDPNLSSHEFNFGVSQDEYESNISNLLVNAKKKKLQQEGKHLNKLLVFHKFLLHNNQNLGPKNMFSILNKTEKHTPTNQSPISYNPSSKSKKFKEDDFSYNKHFGDDTPSILYDKEYDFRMDDTMNIVRKSNLSVEQHSETEFQDDEEVRESEVNNHFGARLINMLEDLFEVDEETGAYPCTARLWDKLKYLEEYDYDKVGSDDDAILPSSRFSHSFRYSIIHQEMNSPDGGIITAESYLKDLVK